MNALPTHSPLGASSAERWINCPGSVELIKHMKLDDSDEPDYRKDGIAAHEAAAHCLAHSQDAWEVVGEKFHGVEVDAEIGDAIQLYLDTVRPHIANSCDDRQVFIEYRVSSPIHPLFYGTVDLAVIERGMDPFGQEILDLTDYKHGEGIMVEVANNPQLMYYAFGILQDFPEIDKVRLRIVQPRGFHADGPVREWVTTAEHIKNWANTVLVPAMLRTEMDNDLDAGSHCRFCPAKLVCPLLTSLFGAAATCNPAEIINVSDAMLARSQNLVQGVKFYIKALEDETFKRMNHGHTVPGWKLVHKKADRVFKEGAEAMFKQVYGDKAYTAPELKTPAQMAKIDAGAKALVTEWAYTPQSGLTVAPDTDARVGVKVETSAEVFGAAVKANTDGLPPEKTLDIPAFLDASLRPSDQ